LRVEMDSDKLESRQPVGSFNGEIVLKHPDTGLLSPVPRLLATSSQEELLFVFDSGRTVTHPVSAVPSGEAEALGWQGAYSEEPRGEEELATILPVARMSMYEFCVQVSRRGCVKKIKEASFETHIARGYIGTGIQSAPDKTCGLAFCGSDDLLVLVSKEGFLVTQEVGRLPYTIEEVLRLGITDHIVTAFTIGKKSSLLVVTHNGKALQKEAGWLDPAVTFKTRGQTIIPKERREAGVRVVGAGAVAENDWGFALRSDGKLVGYSVDDLFNHGSLFSGEKVEILGFTTL
jgi:DNA gyrase/topoisomerase IV subunit A